MARAKSRMQPVVVGVEAIPDNARVFEENVSLNGLASEVTVVRCALGESAKAGVIQVEGDLAAGEGTGTANILPDASMYACVRQEIAIQTLDRLSEQQSLPARCSVIKIDTDGYDLKVLQGGGQFLRKNRPVIFGEFSAYCMNWHQQSIRDVVAFADTHDYLVWQRTSSSWRFTEPVESETYEQDLLLLPTESRQQFAWCLANA